METVVNRRTKLPKYLFFTANGSVFTSRLSDIKEVVNDLELGKVPLQNAFTVGMSSLRGEIISLLSLSRLLSNSISAPIPRQSIDKAIRDEETYKKMITLVIEHKQLKYGLLIDNIKQVRVLDPAQYQEASEYPWIDGHYHFDNTIATVVDLKSLLKHQCPIVGDETARH